MRRRDFLQLAGAVSSGVLAAPVVSARASAQDRPIRIGMSTSSTGPFALASQSGERAFAIWLDDVRRAGGVLHKGRRRQIELVTRDDRSDRQLVPRVYENLIVEERVDLTIAPFGSTLSGAAAVVADRHSAFMAAWSASSDALFQQGYRFIINASVTPGSRQPEVPLDEFKRLGGRRVGIVHVDEPGLEGQANFYRAAALRKALDVVAVEKYPRATRDYSLMLQKLQGARAEIVFLLSYENDVAVMIRQLKENDIDFPAIYTIYAQNQSIRTMGRDADGLWGQAAFDVRAAWPVTHGRSARDFLSAYETRFPATGFPDINVQVAYAMAPVLEAVIGEAEELNGPALRAAATRLSGRMTVMTGRYAIDETGQQVGMNILIHQNFGGDRIEVVAPAEVATAPAIYPMRTWRQRAAG